LADSSTEAEIILWVLDIYASLGYRALISRKYFTVHEHLENGRIQIIHVDTNDMIADFFTKAIMGAKRMKFKVQIMGIDEDGEESIL